MEKNTTIEATLTELTALIRALLDGEVGEEACAFPAANAPIPSVPVPEERAIDMRRRTDTDGAYGTACGVLSRLLPGEPGRVLKHLAPDAETYAGALLHALLILLPLILMHRGMTRYPEEHHGDEAALADILFVRYTEVRKKLHNWQWGVETGDELFQLWVRAYGVPRELPAIDLRANLVRIIKDLRKRGCSDELILQYYFMARTFQKGKVTRETIASVFAPAETVSSPGELYVATDNNLAKCLREFRKTQILDLLRVMGYPKLEDAKELIAAEMGAVLPLLPQGQARKERTAIVFPSPDLIHRYLAYGSDAEMVFVVSTSTLAQTLASEYDTARFGYPDVLGRLQMVIPIDDKHPHIRYQSVEAGLFGRIIVHARPQQRPPLDDLLSGLAAHLTDGGVLSCLMPQSELTGSFRAGLNVHYRVTRAILLPNSEKDPWRKKWLLLNLEQRPEAGEEAAVIMSMACRRQDDAGQDYTCFMPWRVTVPYHAWSGDETALQLWNRYRNKKPPGQARDTRCYRYSREICIWYSWSNGRGGYYYYSAPNPGAAKAGSPGRGKRLTGRVEFRAADLDHAEALMGDRLLAEPLYSVVCRDIRRAYSSRPISLKTFWFLSLDELEKRQLYIADKMAALFCSEALSNLILEEQPPSELFQAIMESDFAGKSKSEQVVLWRQLNLLLNAAVRAGRIKQNPISEHVQTLLERDIGYRYARDNLAKKSYTLTEERAMLRHMNGRLPEDGRYVGAAISFFAGLDDREICALNWGDYHTIPEGPGKQLWVSGYIGRDGNKARYGNERAAAYRRVPVSGQLASILDRRKKYVWGLLAAGGRIITESDLSNLPIVTEDSADKRCGVSALKDVKQEMEAAANIPPLELTAELTDGVKTTDANEYYADRFRANLGYRLRHSCGMSDAESRYILGISQSNNTYAKHYCDFTNGLVQLMLCRKLDRWAYLHREQPAEPAAGNELVFGKTLKTQPKRYGLLDIEINILARAERQSTGTIELHIEDGCGLDIEIARIKTMSSEEETGAGTGF